MKKLLVSILAVSLSTQVYSANISAGTFTIDAIRVSSASGLTYIKTNENIILKNTSCSVSSFMVIKNDDASYQQIYSILLSAAVAKKDVTIWVSAEPDDCLNNNQRISVVEVNF